MIDRFHVDCRGRQATVEVTGEGPDIVMVGAAVPMAWARQSCVELADLGYRVLNFDYGSTEVDSVSRTALEQVDDVVEVLNAVQMDRVHLVGLSRGAMTAYALTARRSELVETLTLAFPVAGFRDTLYLDGLPTVGWDDDPLMPLRAVFGADYLRNNLEDAKRLLSTPPGTVGRVERSEEEAFSNSDVVSVRTLVIEGGTDRVVSPEHPSRYLAAIPGARHATVAGASHGWLMEQPAAFAAIIADFVGSVG